MRVPFLKKGLRVGPPMSRPGCETAGMRIDLTPVSTETAPSAPAGSWRSIRPRRPAQLDFALPAGPAPVRRVKAPAGARPCSRKRADWWFDQMRRLVAEGREMDAPGVF